MHQGKRLYPWISAVLLVLTAGLLITCGVKQTEDPLSAGNFKISESSSLHDGNGAARSEYYYGESMFLSLDNLYPEWQTLVRVRKNGARDCSCAECVNTLLVVTDRLGRIDNLEIWYNIGYDQDGNPLDEAGDYTVQILQTSQNNPWINFKIQFKVIASPPVAPFLFVTNAAGTYQGNGVVAPDKVFVKGGHFGANAEVHLFVAQNRMAYAPGDLYSDVSGGFETATASAAGELAVTEVWSAPVVGVYDVIADVAPFGQYNTGDVVGEPSLATLIVQNPVGGADIITDIACDAYGNYKNTFTDMEAVYGLANPLVRPAELASLLPLCHSNVVVSPHKAIWAKDDPLIHIETVGSMHSPLEVVLDPSSGSMGLTMVRGECRPGYRQPLRLWPGDYDMIVDVNNNNMYDPGVDLLDGGTQVGFTIAGTPPPVKFIFFALPDFEAMGKTPMRAVVLKSDHTPVVGATVSFNVGKGPGEVDPKSVVTDAHGMAETLFWGAEEAKWSIVRAIVMVDGVQYVARISVWGDMCSTHNQGVVIAQ
ncbi:hypothetical protein GX408_10740 [bacterium]|nr:hypothetical protein [bacterium]